MISYGCMALPLTCAWFVVAVLALGGASAEPFDEQRPGSAADPKVLWTLDTGG
jgi:hypothetical protein